MSKFKKKQSTELLVDFIFLTLLSISSRLATFSLPQVDESLNDAICSAKSWAARYGDVSSPVGICGSVGDMLGPRQKLYLYRI